MIEKKELLVPAYCKQALDVVNYVYYTRALELKYHTASQRRSDSTFDDVLNLADEILVDTGDSNSRFVVFLCNEVICRLYCSMHTWQWIMAGDDQSKLKSLTEKLHKALPAMEIIKDGRLPMTFWTSGTHGIVQRSRRIEAPDWSDIEQNYPSEVGAELSKLMEMKPGKSGQLILFHGTPGTGKTTAIRSLLKHWNSWCQGDYIVDPEKFFGGSAEYMIDVLLSNDNTGYDEDEYDDDEEEAPIDPWHLYVIEDSDELLTDDAKARTGQALSRLLNVVDGMIGQGLRLLVLVTTNEPMANIHPAIKRPGRCLANIEFRKFNKQEAGIWLSDKDNAVLANEDKTLAELYHEQRDDKSLQVESDKPVIGFEAAV